MNNRVVKRRKVIKEKHASEILNKSIRYKKQKLNLALSRRMWKLIDKLAATYGDSRDNFISRLIDILAYAKAYLQHPIARKEIVDQDDFFNKNNNAQGSEGVIDPFYKLLILVFKASEESDFIADKMFGEAGVYLTDVGKKNNSDFVKSFNSNFSSTALPKMTFYIRSMSVGEHSDPLLRIKKFCDEINLSFTRLIKALYWDFCIMAGVLNEETIAKVEENNLESYNIVKGIILKTDNYPILKISSNLFVQFQYFKKESFSFRMVVKSSSGEKDLSKNKNTVNFTTNDLEGRLIFETLPILAEKFGRSKNEMLKIILLTTLRNYGVLGTEFEWKDSSQLGLVILENFLIFHEQD